MLKKLQILLALSSAALFADYNNEQYTSEYYPQPWEYYPNEFFIDLLVMQATVDNLEVGTKKTFSDALQQNCKKTVVGYDQQWRPGVRLGYGHTFNCNDHWDLYGIGTFYWGAAKVSASCGPSCCCGCRQPWSSFLGTQWSSVDGKWHVYNTVLDLELGRIFLPSCAIRLRPFVGLRGVWLDLHVDNDYEGVFVNASGISTTTDTSFKGKNDCYGVGMRGGAQFNWMFNNAWSFVSKFSSSLLWGYFDVEEKFIGWDVTTGVLTPFTEKYKEHLNTLRTNLDFSMGFQWEGTCSSFFFGYEMSKWFRFNELFTSVRVIDSSSGFSTATFFKEHLSADVGFQGLDLRYSLRF